MKIVKNFHNKLLKRKELFLELSSPASPSFQEVEKMVAEKEGANVENLVVKFVKGGYGSKHYTAEVFVYENAQDKKDIEQRKKEKKK